MAQPIRMLLEHTGTEYKEKQYKCGPAPDFDKSCWFEIKETLGFDFPNLPYMIDGTYIILFINANWFVKLKFDEVRPMKRKYIPTYFVSKILLSFCEKKIVVVIEKNL